MSDEIGCAGDSSSDVDYEPSQSESTSTRTTVTEESLTHLKCPPGDFTPISPSEYSDDSTPFPPPPLWNENTDQQQCDDQTVLSPVNFNDGSSTSGAEEDLPKRSQLPRRKRNDSGIAGMSDCSPAKPRDRGTDQGAGAPPRRKRRTVYCYFCEEPVLQFARHLVRHHSNELEVIRLTAYKKKHIERKRLLGILRNKGNYLQSKANNFIRPVRKPALKSDSSAPLPCNGCYGYFAKKQLWRHLNKCPARKNKIATVPYSHNLAQNMMLKQVEGNEFLKTNVFPHMRADAVTEAVKTDPLICAYGARFAKTHEQKHQVNFISRKMRELAKLLIALKKADPQIKSLVDALTPTRYQLLVECTKQVAGFDQGNKRFSSPTYAMNIQTSLKDCCEIACNFLYQNANFPDKKSYEEAEFPFKRLIGTITSEWKYDVSHKAANDLQTSAMNKITIVPLATDLYRFKQFLINLGNESSAALQYDENNVQAYKKLLESAYCRVMLLCRKRCGELSRLTVDLYRKSGDRHSYEEFADAIRPSEMLLVRKFKRVVIEGKRQCTPVIFSDDVQRHIDLLLTLRKNFVPETNPYLFGNVKTDNPISGYKVIQRHASDADLIHPEAMTTRCLRKHLATVCQVLSMTDQDVEQLATFMGHSGEVHRKEYRLPDEIFQTAKVSKLLLMMEAGQAGQFKGKTLDEIEVDLDSDILQDMAAGNVNGEDDDDELDASGNHSDHELEDVRPGCSSSVNVDTPAFPVPGTLKKKTKKFIRHAWSEEEKRIALEFFSDHVIRKKAPKKEECEVLVSQHPNVFNNRPWQKIKVFIHNTYSKRDPQLEQ